MNHDQIRYEATGIYMILAVTDLFDDKKPFSSASPSKCQRKCVYNDPLKLIDMEKVTKFGSCLFDKVLTVSNFDFKMAK
jgi:hypothetical protein